MPCRPAPRRRDGRLRPAAAAGVRNGAPGGRRHCRAAPMPGRGCARARRGALTAAGIAAPALHPAATLPRPRPRPAPRNAAPRSPPRPARATRIRAVRVGFLAICSGGAGEANMGQPSFGTPDTAAFADAHAARQTARRGLQRTSARPSCAACAWAVGRPRLGLPGRQSSCTGTWWPALDGWMRVYGAPLTPG